MSDERRVRIRWGVKVTERYESELTLDEIRDLLKWSGINDELSDDEIVKAARELKGWIEPDEMAGFEDDVPKFVDVSDRWVQFTELVA